MAMKILLLVLSILAFVQSGVWTALILSSSQPIHWLHWTPVVQFFGFGMAFLGCFALLKANR